MTRVFNRFMSHPDKTKWPRAATEQNRNRKITLREIAVGNSPEFRHVASNNVFRAGGESMRGGVAVAIVLGGLSIGLAACEGVARPACSTAEDVAAKITALTDDLNAAQTSGKIDALTAGDIAGRIMGAGAQFSRDADHRAYCAALDKIRKETRF
jgi:hypothetical protein